MAFFNEIGAGRYNRLIQKLFNMKGGPPARQLASDVTMVFPFFAGAELRYLESWNLFGFTLTAGPAAGNVAGCRFRNPVGSNVIAVIHRISFQPGTADTINLDLGAQTADLANVTVPAPWDPRTIATGSAIQPSQQSTPTVTAFGTNIWKANLLTQETNLLFTAGHEIPLLPGQAIQGRMTTVNLSIVMNVWWRERALEDSEIK